MKNKTGKYPVAIHLFTFAVLLIWLTWLHLAVVSPVLRRLRPPPPGNVYTPSHPMPRDRAKALETALTDKSLIGKTKAEIRALYGTPAIESDQRWAYYLRDRNSILFGPERIYANLRFSNEQVTETALSDS